MSVELKFQLNESYAIVMDHIQKYGNYDATKDELFIVSTGKNNDKITLVIARSWIDRLAQRYLWCNKELTWDKKTRKYTPLVQDFKDSLATVLLSNPKFTNSIELYPPSLMCEWLPRTSSLYGNAHERNVIGILFIDRFFKPINQLPLEHRLTIKKAMKRKENPCFRNWYLSLQQRWTVHGIATKTEFNQFIKELKQDDAQQRKIAEQFRNSSH